MWYGDFLKMAAKEYDIESIDAYTKHAAYIICKEELDDLQTSPETLTKLSFLLQNSSDKPLFVAKIAKSVLEYATGEKEYLGVHEEAASLHKGLRNFAKEAGVLKTVGKTLMHPAAAIPLSVGVGAGVSMNTPKNSLKLHPESEATPG